MSNVLVNETSLQNIASAIRTKNGSSDTYTPSEMATAIGNIPSGGGKFAPPYLYRPFYQYQGTTLDLTNLDTSNLTSMSYMFNACTNMTTIIGLSSLDTSNVTDMTSIFSGCIAMTSIDLSNWNTSSVDNVQYAFDNCQQLQFLDIRSFTFSTISTTTNLFGTQWFGFPHDCEIIVKDDTEKAWINTNYDWLTNVKTVAEYEGS